MAPTVNGVRHLKVWVSDLGRSREWYERVFGAERVLSFEDADGVVRGMAFKLPGEPFELALRENPELAKALYDADPFALATSRQDLDAWIAHLEGLGIWHSPVIQASRGWAMGFRDPDGMQIRLYADDESVAAGTGDRVVTRETPAAWQAPPRSDAAETAGQ
ncbi:VOC family protein [Nonomuraea sp. JJY05]|uniref:VOC family protein n=1 Tax=Nonomuraea sp. JJY05 TaxID=3350255 RepID=UPI00373E3BF3